MYGYDSVAAASHRWSSTRSSRTGLLQVQCATEAVQSVGHPQPLLGHLSPVSVRPQGAVQDTCAWRSYLVTHASSACLVGLFAASITALMP